MIIMYIGDWSLNIVNGFIGTFYIAHEGLLYGLSDQGYLCVLCV